MDLFYMRKKRKQPVNRPYAISRDVNDLESKKPVTRILRSDAFRGKLEDIFRNLSDCGTPPAIRRLQSNITPAPQIEKSIRQHNQPNLVKLSRSTNQTTVIPINDLHGVNSDKYSIGEKHARCKLASLYRVIDRMGWTFEIYNHISLRYPGNDESFLINAFGLHYSEVTASNLIKTNLRGDIIDPGSTRLGLNRAGYVMHSAIHEARRDIKCIIHLNTPHGAAVSAMSCGLLPLCQEALIVGGLSYHAYRGIICNETEKAEIAKDLGPTNKAMVLHNRGLLAMGSTVEEAYYICTNLMVACKTQVLAISAGLNNVILVDNLLAKKVYNTAIRAGGDVAYIHRLKAGELEYEAIMRVLDNQGYNTGYPYNTMELLCPPCTHQAAEQKTKNINLMQATTSTAQTSDINSITEKIKQQLDRIRREKKLNATTTERDSSNLERSISPSHIDLEYIAKHSSGTTQPVCYKSAPYEDPHIVSAKSSEFSIDLNNSIHCDEKRNHPVATQIGMSFDNSQALVDNVYSESSTTANHVHFRVDQKTIEEISSAQAEKHIWDFLDERQSMGPLPISKKLPHSYKLHSECVLKSSDRSVHNPSVSSNHSDRVNSLSDNHCHITWDKQYLSTGIPNGMIDQPHHLHQQISSSQNPLQHSNSNSMQLQTNKTVTSPMKITSEDLPISNDGTNIEMLTGNQSVLSSTDRANFKHLTDWSHSQIRPSVESPPLSGTPTKSYYQLGSNTQSPQPYITLSPSQVTTKTSDSSNSVEYDSNHAHSDSCSIDHNSNPSITDLRTGGAQMTLGVMQFPIQPDAKSKQSFQNPSSKPPINRDLEILLKVEETAKTVANSTGKSVHKLSHHRHQQKQIRNREHMELQLTTEIPTNDSDMAKHNLTNFYTTIVPSATTTDIISTTEPSAIYQPLPHTPLKQVTPTSQLIYMYSPPFPDDSLVGLEKAINTAKKVAESTEMSIVKLRTSQNIVKSSQINVCNDNDELDNADCV